MAVLGKIRKHSFFLIVIIALALFSFVLADVIKSGTFDTNSNLVGSVDGVDIEARQFMATVSQMEQQNPNLSKTQALNSVWEQEVRKVVINNEVEKLGLGLGDEQLINEIKKNPYFAQNPSFLNEAGAFDEGKFKEFVISIQNDPNQDRWNEWKKFEGQIEEASVQQLFNAMVKGGIYTTKAEGQFAYIKENKKVDFSYVTVPYTTINDDEVKVSDDEILAYMKKHPKQYKSDNTRNIEYVYFENKPSEADEKERKAAMDKVMYGQVVYNKATETNDTLLAFKDVPTADVRDFINKNSDVKFDSIYVTKSELPLDYQEQLFNLSVGEVFGPYVNDGKQNASRMLAKKANGSVRASHILISFAGAPRATVTRTKEEAQTLANELLAQAKANPAGFAALATANTDDPGSKTTGGEYDNIMPGQMVPEFDAFIFDNPVGSIGLVETTFGYHVIKVNEQYSSVLLGTVSLNIEPSQATIDNIYTQASKFEADANSKDFAAVAKAFEVTVVPSNNLKAMDEQVAGIGAQREIVRWAFNDDTEVGDVSRFDVSIGFAVAKLTNINTTGLLSLDVARESVGKILRNEKKAAKIREKMKGSTLDEVAKATGGSVLAAGNVTMNNPSIPNVGREAKVVGTAFALANDKVSGLIDGEMGVYMIKKLKTVEAPEVSNYNTQISRENQQQANSAQSRAYQALKEKAKIEENLNNM